MSTPADDTTDTTGSAEPTDSDTANSPDADATNSADADAQRNQDEMPSDEDLQEPSVAKEPGEEPKADKPLDPEPDHEAVGIGVIPTPDDEQ
ncbi:hypothetical protein K8F61_10460 [Microbacterium resistens]|uniref:Uncharacterized protein n=1 Tax=Microbacterium resistens TaxID=156977 RepID=A0ABY3RX57_9MICO|nr:hypothetical protein [Microbacterium resistens]UGS28668.1 hypothetical protein K8F61_10460 [Microbacterium resistens]